MNSFFIHTLLAFTVMAVSLVANGGDATPFKACKVENLPKSKASGPQCTREFDLTTIPMATVASGEDEFYKKLRDEVHAELSKIKVSYAELRGCLEGKGNKAKCSMRVSNERKRIREDWPKVTEALAISQPTDIDINMRNREVAWFTSSPKHPFRSTIPFAPLSPDEQASVKEAYLRRLTKKVPSVGIRRKAEGEKFKLLALDKTTEVDVDKAMVQIRNETHDEYLELISRNPTLVFIEDVGDGPNAPTNAQMKAAVSQVEAEIEGEIKKLAAGYSKGEVEKKADLALLDHKPIVDRLLKKNKHLCGIATAAYNRAQSRKAATRTAIAAAHFGASVLTLLTCSGVVTCAGGTALLTVADVSVSQHRANEAFKTGIVRAATPNHKRPFKDAEDERANTGVALGLGMGGTFVDGLTMLRTGAQVLKGARVAETTTEVARAAKSEIRGLTAGRKAPTAADLVRWQPENVGQTRSYFALHIREVNEMAEEVLRSHPEVFRHIKRSNLKALRTHDMEKLLDFETLKKNFGYKGIPRSIVEDIQGNSGLLTRLSDDGQYVEISVVDALHFIWGKSKENLPGKIASATTAKEKRHLEAMLQFRHHLINSMETIDQQIQRQVFLPVGNADARVEMRFLDMLSDKSARMANPMTEAEMGRPIYGRLDYFLDLEKEKYIGFLADPTSPEEIAAAERLLQRISRQQIQHMSNRLQANYRSSGLPTSLRNTLLSLQLLRRH